LKGFHNQSGGREDLGSVWRRKMEDLLVGEEGSVGAALKLVMVVLWNKER